MRCPVGVLCAYQDLCLGVMETTRSDVRLAEVINRILSSSTVPMTTAIVLIEKGSRNERLLWVQMLMSTASSSSWRAVGRAGRRGL
jgi:hypothetical protein